MYVYIYMYIYILRMVICNCHVRSKDCTNGSIHGSAHVILATWVKSPNRLLPDCSGPFWGYGCLNIKTSNSGWWFQPL